MSFFGILKSSLKNSIMALFALPSIGGAVILILIAPLNGPITSFFEAFG
jgi:hypothetical protein